MYDSGFQVYAQHGYTHVNKPSLPTVKIEEQDEFYDEYTSHLS